MPGGVTGERLSMVSAFSYLSRIFFPNALALARSFASGRPCAVGISGTLKECSQTKTAAAMGWNPTSETMSPSSRSASS